MEQKNVLNIIANSFPYGLGEQFFEAEVENLAKYYQKIVLFPLSKQGEVRKLPTNVSVNDALISVNTRHSKLEILKNLGLIFRVMGYEWRLSNKKRFILKKMKFWIPEILHAKRLGNAYRVQMNDEDKAHHYSFWMNEGTLALSILKMKRKISGFDFRVNGYDIFAERHEENYMPYRFFNYRWTNHVYVLSTPALTYLKGLNWQQEKLVYAPYGIYAQELNQLDEKAPLKMVSCSNMIPLKRIDKIIAALKLIEKPVHWIHFGDGELRTELEKQAVELPDHIQVDLKGYLPNSAIINLYQNESVNLFIHTSETEGLGMAIIEAQSFGIPAVVIGVGGVVDIVTEKTGAVLPADAEGAEIAAAIQQVVDSDKNSQAYRSKIQSHCLSIFGADKNYRDLYEAMQRPYQKIKN